MTVTGLIAEYNPFHNGHLHHMNMAQKTTGANRVIVVMSGNFVQRGMPAIFDKYIRTEMALRAGADMVLELPVYYAGASAEFFGRGAVSILEGTGIVNHLCFGSETADIRPLDAAASFFTEESDFYREALKAKLSSGLSYPRARQEAVKIVGRDDIAPLLETPNNILAVEYLKALKQLNSPIKPCTIMRTGSGYHDTLAQGPMASATALRAALGQKDMAGFWQGIPDVCRPLMEKELLALNAPIHINEYSPILHYILKTCSVNTLSAILDMDEGLENRVLDYSGRFFYITDLLAALKNKRVTMMKLQRALLHTLLNIRRDDFAQFELAGGPQYIRVLGFRKESADLFKAMEKKAALPFVTNLKNASQLLSPLALKMLNKEIETTDIYYLGQKSAAKKPKPKNYEYQKPLVVI